MEKLYKYLSDSSKAKFERDHENLLKENLVTNAEFKLVKGIDEIVSSNKQRLGLALDFFPTSKNTFWVLDNSSNLACYNSIFGYLIFNRENLSCKTIFHELFHAHSTDFDVSQSRFSYINRISQKSGISSFKFPLFPFWKRSMQSGLYYPKTKNKGTTTKKTEPSRGMLGGFLNEGLTEYLSVESILRHKSEVIKILNQYVESQIDTQLVDRIGKSRDVSYRKNYKVIELLYEMIGDITQVSEQEISDILSKIYFSKKYKEFEKILLTFLSINDLLKILRIHHSKKSRGEKDEHFLDNLLDKLSGMKESGNFSSYHKSELNEIINRLS